MYFPEQLSAVSSSDRGTYLAGKYISIARIPTFSGRDWDMIITFQLSDAKRKLARVCTAQLIIQIAKRSKVSRLSNMEGSIALLWLWKCDRVDRSTQWFFFYEENIAEIHFHFTLHFRRDVKQFIFVVSEPHVPRIGVENRSSIILSYSVNICPHLNNLHVNATQRCLRVEGNK